MRGQSTEASCGPMALYNSLRALGVERSIEECEKLCGVTMTNGATTKKLCEAIKSVGFTPTVIRERRRDIAMMRLLAAGLEGRPVIIVVKQYEVDDHYVAVLCSQGTSGQRYLVADSADHELVVSRSAGEIAAWWGQDSYSCWGVVLGE